MARNTTQSPQRPTKRPTTPASGARSVGAAGDGRRRRGLGWLWALLGLLALGLLIAALAGAFSSSDKKAGSQARAAARPRAPASRPAEPPSCRLRPAA